MGNKREASELRLNGRSVGPTVARARTLLMVGMSALGTGVTLLRGPEARGGARRGVMGLPSASTENADSLPGVTGGDPRGK